MAGRIATSAPLLALLSFRAVYLLAHDLLSYVLQTGVQRGINRETRAVDDLRVILGFQQRPDVIHPVWVAHLHVGWR